MATQPGRALGYNDIVDGFNVLIVNLQGEIPVDEYRSQGESSH